MNRAIRILLLVLFGLAGPLRADVFYNPIISDGADPWVIFKDSFYYYTQTTGFSVTVRKWRISPAQAGWATPAP